MTHHTGAVQSDRELEYLAGYFDAAGSISICRAKQRFILRLDLQREQRHAPAFDLLTKRFGRSPSLRRLPSEKLALRWLVQYQPAVDVLNTLGPHLRVKTDQWRLSQEFAAQGADRTAEQSMALAERMRAANAGRSTAVHRPLTDPYTAGLFDAHGYLGYRIRKRASMEMYAYLALKQAGLLQAIEAQYGGRSYSTRRGPVLALYGRQAGGFLRRLLPDSRVKRPDIERWLELETVRAETHARVRDEDQRSALLEAAGAFDRPFGISLPAPEDEEDEPALATQ